MNLQLSSESHLALMHSFKHSSPKLFKLSGLRRDQLHPTVVNRQLLVTTMGEGGGELVPSIVKMSIFVPSKSNLNFSCTKGGVINKSLIYI